MTGLSWAQLVEAGIAHVEHLADRDDAHEKWVAVASDGSVLATIERVKHFAGQAPTWMVHVYRAGPRPPGGTTSMRNWVHDWQAVYTSDQILLADIAALVG